METMMAISERDFGSLESKVRSIEEDVTEVKSDVKQILSQLSGSAGGWKMLSLIAGGAAVVGGMIVKFIPALAHLG